MSRPADTRKLRAWRAATIGPLAEEHGGVVRRRDLRLAGVTRDDIRTEVRAGRWTKTGRRTVVVGSPRPVGEGILWHAVWETGTGAILDGVSALQAAGLTGFNTDHIDVSLEANRRHYEVDGVRAHLRRELGPRTSNGLPRALPAVAAVRGALWAKSPRQAALILCMTVQQRLVAPPSLLSAWTGTVGERHRALGQVVLDICDGVHSLGELDFAALCREYGIPEPSRQVLHQLSGRTYLDVEWEDVGLVVEIDGGHHLELMNAVADALRQNEVTLTGRRVLRMLVIGLRLQPDAFMNQVRRAYEDALRGQSRIA